MTQFRRLILVVFAAGTLSGLALFVLRHFTVVPLILAAETYETSDHEAHSKAATEEGWRPAEGWERTSFTALTTVLTGIAFAAILFGVMALSGKIINTRHGALWGLAAFTCFSLAPALEMPPQPPGGAVADLDQRQLWWVGTVIATAAGLWLITGQKRTWLLRSCGAACLLLPHLIGGPTPIGLSSVPIKLARQFAITSVASNCIFWLMVGTLGGLIYSRTEAGTQTLKRA